MTPAEKNASMEAILAKGKELSKEASHKNETNYVHEVNKTKKEVCKGSIVIKSNFTAPSTTYNTTDTPNVTVSENCTKNATNQNTSNFKNSTNTSTSGSTAIIQKNPINVITASKAQLENQE